MPLSYASPRRMPKTSPFASVYTNQTAEGQRLSVIHAEVIAKESIMTRISTFCVCVVSSMLGVLALSANVASAAGSHGSGGGGGAGKAVTGTTSMVRKAGGDPKSSGKPYLNATAAKKGKVNMNDISVTKKTDKSSPLTINYGKIEKTYTPQKSDVKDSHDR